MHFFLRPNRLLVVCLLVMGAMLAAQSAASQAPAAKQPSMPHARATEVLGDLSSSFEAIASEAGRSVVQIFARSYVPAAGSDREGELLTAQNSSGSGVILSADGYILTNAHVVAGARNLKVQLPRATAQGRQGAPSGNGRALAARLVGVDRETDLAVIKIERTGLPFLTFGNSRDLRQGQIVLALGNPLGLENSVSFGVVSAVSRTLKPDSPLSYIQTDAPINPGNSGGPLINGDGKVVGINSFILSQSGGSEGIGFAIPSSVASLVYSQIRRIGHVHRAEIGLLAQTITPELAEGLSLQQEHGAIVSDVEPGGPADHAGMKPDDVILALNGRPINDVRQIETNIFRQGPGQKFVFRVQRGEEELDVPVVTVERAEQMDKLADLADAEKNTVPQLGILGIDLTAETSKLLPPLRRPAGVIVAARRSGTPYTGAALEVGDAIYSINRHVVNSTGELRAYLDQLKSGAAVVLQVERDNRLLYVPLELD